MAGCERQEGSATVSAELSDRFPSTTAEDWVTYADFAAEVEVADERSSAPSAEDLKRGEGDLERTVILSIEDVLWRAPGGEPPPTELEYSALGWRFDDADANERKAIVADDRPRLEVGHKYVLAFHWQAERCYEGDGVIPAHWNGLGAGSVLPYADDTIGVGEFAGERRDLDEARADAEELPDDSVAAAAVGQDAHVIAAMLDATQPGKVEDFGPTPSDC
jgi:hypothetical protein